MAAVIDLHCDTVKFLSEGIDLRKPNPAGHVDLPRLRRGGVGLQVFAAYVAPSTAEEQAFSAAMGMLDRIGEFAASDPLLRPVETAEESSRVMKAGKTGILKAVENGWAIEDSLDKLEELRRQKVRIMTLVHSRHTHWAASCTGETAFPPTGAAPENHGGGLSPFGEKVIAAMNDLGIMVDLSHGAESTFWDAVKLSKKPIIASHSCAYELCASPRNLKDDQLKALGDARGVVGVCFFPTFLNDAYRKALDAEGGNIFRQMGTIEKQFANDPAGLLAEREKFEARMTELLKENPVPFTVIADHIDYIVKLAGEDAIALGSDFDGIYSLPTGVTGCDFYPLLEEELRRRSYTAEQITKFFSANFLRVFREHDR
ncbi:membrane dipeptidase [Spirochaetia bacterium]|nr:membrane dipeptidase [Spirochaetia bacterium]